MIELLRKLILVICIAPGIFISMAYGALYMYDSIFEYLVLKIGHFLGKNFPIIKEKKVIKKLWQGIQPKELYLRYETPLVTYCFSYGPIYILVMLITCINGKKNFDIFDIMIAYIVYILIYYIGMLRKCRNNKNYYEQVLKNNMDFLKLSLLPAGFSITIIGFIFTITGIDIQNGDILNKINIIITNYLNNENIFVIIIIIFVIYIISIPIQVLAYFTISIIEYIRQYKVVYIALLKNCLGILKKYGFTMIGNIISILSRLGSRPSSGIDSMIERDNVNDSQITIFYSWQSDLPESETRNIIQDSIKDAVCLLKDTIDIESDRDTKGEFGSLDIVQTIFSKIDSCDIFIADVSAVCQYETVDKDGNKKIKHMPNPNVMIELGYATNVVGWDNVICVLNTDYGVPENMPFDIASQRLTTFSLKDGKSKREVKKYINRVIQDTVENTLENRKRVKEGL